MSDASTRKGLVDDHEPDVVAELVGRSKRVVVVGHLDDDVVEELEANGCDVQRAAKAAELDGAVTDVVVLHDVLEPDSDAEEALRFVRRAFGQGGMVIVSFENASHADRLLAAGRTEASVLDLATIERLLGTAGFVTIDRRRVTCPVFGTGLVDRTDVTSSAVDDALSGPDAETVRFVLRAVVHDGDAEIRALAERTTAAEERAREELFARLSAEVEAATARADAHALRRELHDAKDALDRAEQERDEADARAGRIASDAAAADAANQAEIERWREEAILQATHVEALRSTRVMRTLEPLRSVYAALRRLRT